MRSRTPWHPPLSLLLGSLLAVTGLLLTAPTLPRAAATQGAVGQGIHVPIPGYGETWLGAFEAPTGVDAVMAWCIQMWVAPGVGAPPVSVAVHDDPVLAWLIETFADPGNALDQAAIAYTVHQRAEVPGVVADGDVAAAKQLLADAAPAAVRDRSAAMVATAEAQAGPYQGPTPTVSSSDPRYGTVDDVGVLSASGQWVADLDVTAELLMDDGSGALIPADRAVFDVNGNHLADPDESNVWTGRTLNGPLSLKYAAGRTGGVLARVRVGGLRTTQLEVNGMDPTRQNNLSLHPGRSTGPSERSGDTVPFAVAPGFQITGLSAVDRKVLDPGDPACDSLDVQPAPGHSWLSVDGAPVSIPIVATLWRTGEQPTTSSDLARAVDEVRMDVSGPGVVRVCADPAAVAGSGAGILTWQWRTDRDAMPAEQRDILLREWRDDFGLSPETSSLRHTPDVVTSLSVRSTKGGLRLVDDLWADGYPSDHGSFTGGAGFDADRPDERTELWFFPTGTPVTDSALANGSATLIGTVRRPAANGYASLSAPDLDWPNSDRDTDGDGVSDPLPGTVAARTLFDGDDRARPVGTSVEDVTEQFTITPPASGAEPLRVTTSIQSGGNVDPGDTVMLSDATDVFGTVPGDGTVLTNALYRWDGDDPICSPETLIDPGDPIVVTDAGAFLSAPVAVTAEPGASYGYVETLRNTVGQVLHRGVCGAVNETIRVPAPGTVTTTAHADSTSPVVGDELWDTITWAGDLPEGATTTAELFHSAGGDPLTCTSQTRVWTSVPLGIDSSPGSADTDRFRAQDPGRYGFVETTRAPDGTVLSTGTCGEASETLTVAAPASVSPAAPPVAVLLALTGSPTRALVTAALALVAAGGGVLAVRWRHRLRNHRAPRTS